MQIEIQTKQQATPKQTEIFEIAFIGQITETSAFLESTLSQLQTQLQKCGVTLLFYIDKTSHYGWFKFSTHSNTRGAGRKRENQTNKYTQLDILCLLTDHSNKEIWELLNISESTYYRAKRRLIKSPLFNAIKKDGALMDKARLSQNRIHYTDNQGNLYYASPFLL